MPPLPTQRLSPTAICLSDKAFLVIGGGAGDQHTFPTVEMAERSSGGVWAWRALTPMNESRRAPGVSQLNESYLHIAGGYRKISAEIFRLPTSRFDMGQWTQIRHLHQKCVGLARFLGSIIAFGELIAFEKNPPSYSIHCKFSIALDEKGHFSKFREEGIDFDKLGKDLLTDKRIWTPQPRFFGCKVLYMFSL